MLIVALVLAAVGLAALVFAVVTSNALVAWVCIAASVLGVLLLIVDAVRERRAGVAKRNAVAVDELDEDELDERAGQDELDDDDPDLADEDEVDAGAATVQADAADAAAETVEVENTD